MRSSLNTSVAALLLSTSAYAADTANQSSVSVLPTFAQQKPAVDGVNGKLTLYGGAGEGNSIDIAGIPGLSPAQSSTGWKGAGGGIGTITVPIVHSFGAQVDLGSGTFGNRPLGHATGHLFWRDPDKGLIGAYGSGLLYGNNVGRGVWTAAGEFEAYLGKLTGRAILGAQGASSYRAGVSPFDVYSYGGPKSFTTPDYFTDIVSATFYPLDDLALTVGHVYSFNRNAVTGEVEYLLPQFRGSNIAPSAFVRAAYGWNNSSNILAGVRIYFGNHDKTLIRRQREDDPQSNLPTFCGGHGACGAHDLNIGLVGFPDTHGSMGLVSDARLKKDISPVGCLESGVILYSYRYLGDERTFVGVMAQELLAKPEFQHAVVTGADGFYRVNYNALGLEVTNVAAMRAAGARALSIAIAAR
jgi:hypothetical protein